MAYSQMHRAVVVVGSEAGECRGLPACDASDLGHAHQDGHCGLEPHTVHALDQIKPLGQVAVMAEGRRQVLEPGSQHTDDDLLLIPTPRLDPDPIDLMPLEPNR